MQSTLRIILPILLVFIILTALIFLLAGTLEKFHIDANVLHAGNIFFLLLSMMSFAMQRKGMMHKNPHVFIRSVTGGMLVKMVLTVIAVILYVNYSKEAFNKRSIFIALFLYLVYLSVEVMVVMKMNKKQHA